MFCRRGTIFLRKQNFTSNIRCLCKEIPPSEVPPVKEESEDDNTEKKKISTASTDAKDKLNSLLASFTKEASKPKQELKVAKPHGVRKLFRKERLGHREMQEKKMFDAAHDVAQSYGGEVEQTEQDLIDRVKSHLPYVQQDIEQEDIAAEPESAEVEKKSVDEETLKKTRTAMSETLMGMKVDRTPPKEEESFTPRSGQYRRTRDYDDDSTPRSRLHEFRRPTWRDRDTRDQRPVDFDGAEPLNIFSPIEEYKQDGTRSVLETWDELTRREMRLSVMHAPRNCFEEMIRWTEKGMLWKLPLDNEEGLDELNVSFADHIFLENYIEDWCPKKGPIRHFMELVCTGLSKNPYLTVERKRAHLDWYRDYFAEKEELLKELGAVQQ